MGSADRIEREVTIAAPVQRVWKLVSEPGWWIGDGDRSGQRRWREGELEVIDDPRYGRFPIRTVASEPQRYISYRWVSEAAGESPRTGSGTLVEFWLSEQSGGTLLKVVESGFAALAVSEETRAKQIEGNTAGWREQLDIAKAVAERVAA